MSFESTGGFDDPIVAKSEAIVRLCSVLHAQWAAEIQASLLEATRLPLSAFLAWLQEHAETANVEAATQYVTKADATLEHWHSLLALGSCPEGVTQLAKIWPQIVLNRRPLPVHKLDSLHIIALLRWADGSAAPLSSLILSDMASKDGTFTDGIVASLIQANSDGLVSMLVDNNLDVMHDHRSKLAKQDDFEIVMGLILRMLDGWVMVDPNAKPNAQGGQDGLKLAASCIEGCRNVMRVLQAMFSPPMPPEVKNRILEIQKQRQAAQAPQAPVEGGWNG